MPVVISVTGFTAESKCRLRRISVNYDIRPPAHGTSPENSDRKTFAYRAANGLASVIEDPWHDNECDLTHGTDTLS